MPFVVVLILRKQRLDTRFIPDNSYSGVFFSLDSQQAWENNSIYDSCLGGRMNVPTPIMQPLNRTLEELKNNLIELTGRKIISDTYGGKANHGGGAFSGKDPSKVDRSGAYAARYIAKNIVAAGLADECIMQLTYAIGIAEPVSINIDTNVTGKVKDTRLEQAVTELFECTPAGIIKRFDLKRPIYRETASFGHFGRTNIEFPWEQTDVIPELLSYFHFKN